MSLEDWQTENERRSAAMADGLAVSGLADHHDGSPVEKWASLLFVSKELLNDAARESIEASLIASMVADVEATGRRHVPGGESVAFVDPDDPNAWHQIEGEQVPPPGTLIAQVSARFVVVVEV